MSFGYQILGFGSGVGIDHSDAAWCGDRGVFSGGDVDSSIVNTMDYITVSSAGDASDFGNLSTNRINKSIGGASSGTRGVTAGGYDTDAAGASNVMDYITFSSTGNATDFGDLTLARYTFAGCSNGTRGLFAGGRPGSGVDDTIDYITIASVGNATDFGDLSTDTRYSSALADATRGVIIVGKGTGDQDIMEYVTIASTGNATDFGNYFQDDFGVAACSDATRGVMGSGSGSDQERISYITIQTTGDAADFGDSVITDRGNRGALSNGTRGVWGGGYSLSGYINSMDFLTIQTTGDSVDFGDLVNPQSNVSAMSGD